MEGSVVIESTDETSCLEIQDHTTGKIHKRKRRDQENQGPVGNEEREKDGLHKISLPKTDCDPSDRKKVKPVSVSEYLEEIEECKICLAKVIKSCILDHNKGSEYAAKVMNTPTSEYIQSFKSGTAWMLHKSNMHRAIVLSMIKAAGTTIDDLGKTKEEQERALLKLEKLTRNIANLVDKLP